MDIEFYRKYALQKKGATECTPFGDSVLVYKVNNKIFMMMDFEEPPELSLKCDPELAAELRERYSAVKPAFHMNKIHWNNVILDGEVHSRDVLKMIDHSYELIAKPLKQKKTK